MMRRVLIFTVLFAACSLYGKKSVSLFELPVGAVITENNISGNTWMQNGYINVTYIHGSKLLFNTLQKQGWRRQQLVPMGRKNDRCLAVFRKNNNRITVMIWSEKVNKTGFSWGLNPGK